MLIVVALNDENGELNDIEKDSGSGDEHINQVQIVPIKSETNTNVAHQQLSSCNNEDNENQPSIRREEIDTLTISNKSKSSKNQSQIPAV